MNADEFANAVIKEFKTTGMSLQNEFETTNLMRAVYTVFGKRIQKLTDTVAQLQAERAVEGRAYQVEQAKKTFLQELVEIQ